MNILCIIPTLGHGGAQRVLVELAEHLHTNRLNTISFLVFKGDEDYIYKVSPDIPVHCIKTVSGNNIGWLELLRTPIQIRKIVKSINPDTIITFQDVANFPTLLATIGLKTNLIISERVDPTYYTYHATRKILRSLLYPLANSIVVQTQHIADLMPKSTLKRVKVIPNPAPEVASLARPDIPFQQNFQAIAAGRLEDQKNFSFLINAIAHAQPHLKNWQVAIYGEGSQRKVLQKQIETLGLKRLVTIHKACDNLGIKMQQSNMFLLSSKFEGFPNVLLEAIAHGLPCIANRRVSGVKEMIQDGVNGILLPEKHNTPELFGDALAKLANNPDLLKKMGARSAYVATLYHRKSIYRQWQDLLDTTHTQTKG